MLGCLIRASTVALFLWLVACGVDRSDTDYYVSAAEHYAVGDLEGVLIETKNALRINPQNVQARLLRAKANLQMDDAAAATDDLLRAQELGSVDVQLKPLLARALYRQSKYDQVMAIDHLSISEPAALSDLRATQALAASALDDQSIARVLIGEALSLDSAAVYSKLAKARIELAGHDYVASRESVEKILQQKPEYSLALSLLAEIELKAGNIDAAEKAYSKAIYLQVRPFDDLLARAQLRISEQRFDEAEEDLQRLEQQGGQLIGAADDPEPDMHSVMKQDARYIGVVYARGLLLYEQRQYEAAALLFEKALGQSKDYMPALLVGGATEFQLGREAQAEQKMRRVIELEPGHLIASRLLAMNRLRLGDQEEAELLLRDALIKNPKDTLVLTLLAQALLMRDDNPAAVELLQQVVTLQPESPQARLALADGLQRSNMRSEAEAELEAAALSDPALVTASTGLISLRLSRGENDSALAAAKSFVQANSTSATAQNLLASTHLQLDDIEAARESFTRALELSPGDPVASQGLAALAMRSGQTDLARSHYQSALSQHPDNLSILVGLAALEASAGREERSIELLQQATAAHPEHLEPRMKLALVYLMRGRAAEVPNVLNPVRSRYPSNAALLWLLADSARQTQQINSAIELYRAAARLAPKNARLRYAVAKSEAAAGDLVRYPENLLAALRLDPMLHPARVDYARELVRGNQLESAGEQVAWLRQQQYITPDTLLVEGQVLTANGDLVGAAEKYQEIFALAPNNINLLRLVDIRWQQHEYVDAIERMTNWLAVHPDDPLTQLQLARRYELTSRHDDAIDTLENLVAAHPDNVMAINNLAWLLRGSNPSRALELAQRAYALAPESAHVMDTLSVLLMNHGGEQQLRQAVQLNRLARESLVDEPTIALHTAQLQQATGDIEGAQKTLHALLRNHSKFEARIQAEELLASLKER